MLASALRPAVFADRDGESAVELYIDREAYPRVFAGDLPAPVAAVAASTQRPITYQLGSVLHAAADALASPPRPETPAFPITRPTESEYP